jgi:hypothetical protein
MPVDRGPKSVHRSGTLWNADHFSDDLVGGKSRTVTTINLTAAATGGFSRIPANAERCAFGVGIALTASSRGETEKAL